jgi:hypothetical protein
MRTASPIKLEFWQDPQSDVILIYSERECSVYFRCWSSAGVPADYIGQLAFRGVSAVRSFPREFLPYQITHHNEKSYVLKVADSDLASDYVDYRKLHYPESPLRENTHFVVIGHDIYHEILATSFDAITIPKAETTDTRLLRLVADE